MKSYTDITQSKKLIELGIDINTADMWWNTEKHYPEFVKTYREHLGEQISPIPVWSLAALIDVLPNEISTGENFADKYQIDIRKYDWEDGTIWYQIAYGNDRGSSGEWHDMINTGEKENIIDCCYQMIVRLKEKDLLK